MVLRLSRRLGSACAGVSLAVLLMPAAAPAEIVIAENGAAPCPIYAPTGANMKRHTATPEGYLAQYLQEITGATFAISYVAAAPTAGAGIVVGDFGAADAAELPGDSWMFKTSDDGLRLQILGTTRRALFMGVCAFLQEHLGCRWWSYTEEDVPRLPTIRLAPINHTQQAVFRQTELMNNEATTRLNAFEYKSRGVSTEKMSGGHTLYKLLSPYARSHPEIYPQIKRKSPERKPNKLHFCYTAPGIAAALAKALEGEIKKRRGNVRDYIYFAGMGDWYGGWCQCDRCWAVYADDVWHRPDGKDQNAPSATLIRMINRAAELLEKKYPGVRVGTFAYMSLEGPPGKTVPRENVVIQVPHLRHCIIHGVAECEKNQRFRRNLERWCELAPGRVYVWDYTLDFGENFLYPLPVINAMADNLKLYAKLGVAGVRLQGNYVSTGSDMVVLKNWVWSRLMWDPTLDTTALLKEFCEGYYGPAAASALAYVTELEAGAHREGAPHLNEFAKAEELKRKILTPERTAKLRSALDRAREQAGDSGPYARRVEELAVGLEAVELWHKRLLVEQDGKLLQKIGDTPVYTYPRALRLIENCRQASPREWNAFRSYHQSFLMLHGGPVVTLRRGQLEIKVTPVIGLRLRQITFAGKRLLYVPRDARVKGYPAVGGACEQVVSAWRHGVLDGSPTATKVMMSTASESGRTIEQRAKKTVELLDGGLIRITAATKAERRRPGHNSTRCTGVVEYAASTVAPPVVEFLPPGGGEWQTLTLAAPAAADQGKQKDKAKKAAGPLSLTAEVTEALAALRVTLPDRGCVVEERYPEPGVPATGATVSWQRKSGILKTAIATAARPVNAEDYTPWLVRELHVTPAAEAAAP